MDLLIAIAVFVLHALSAKQRFISGERSLKIKWVRMEDTGSDRIGWYILLFCSILVHFI